MKNEKSLVICVINVNVQKIKISSFCIEILKKKIDYKWGLKKRI